MEETEEVFTTFEMVYHNEAEAIAQRCSGKN